MGVQARLQDDGLDDRGMAVPHIDNSYSGNEIKVGAAIRAK
jgi:hypothetical protein